MNRSAPTDEIRIRRREFNRIARLGCVPGVVVTSLLLVVACNAITFFKAPPYVSDPRGYLFLGRLSTSLAVLAVIQVVVMWVAGLLAAGAGVGALRPGGQFLSARLAIIRRRSNLYAWALLVVRLLLLIALILGLIVTYTRFFGSRLSWDPALDLRQTVRAVPLIALPALAAGLLHWGFGPFLRIRYSLALGALAASFVSDPAQRRWAALAGRLAAGLMGGLAFLWGGALLAFVSSELDYAAQQLNREWINLFPRLPNYVATLLEISLVWLGATILYAAGQLFLPLWYQHLTRRRLRSQSASAAPPAAR